MEKSYSIFKSTHKDHPAVHFQFEGGEVFSFVENLGETVVYLRRPGTLIGVTLDSKCEDALLEYLRGRVKARGEGK